MTTWATPMPPPQPPADLDPALQALWAHYFQRARRLARWPAWLAYRRASQLANDKRRLEAAWAQRMADGVRRIWPAPGFAERTVDAFYAMAAREILDVFFLPTLRPRDLGGCLRPQGFEWLPPAGDGRGTIIAMGHYGRPIMLSTALGLSGRRIGMLSQAVDARNPDLNAVMQAYLQFKMTRTAAAAGGRWLTTLDPPRQLYAALEQGETLIIMLDVVQERAKKRFPAPFLGGELAVPMGILRLLQQTGARLLYGAASDDGRSVETVLRRLPDAPDAAMTAAIGELERDVVKSPWQWWQWGQLEALWQPGPSPATEV